MPNWTEKSLPILNTIQSIVRNRRNLTTRKVAFHKEEQASWWYYANDQPWKRVQLTLLRQGNSLSASKLVRTQNE